MKKIYTTPVFSLFLLAALLQSRQGLAQCPNGNPAGQKMYDTTIAFGVGVTNKQIKFPKFDPTTGMLSCVKLIVTLVGVVNYAGMQNLATTSSNQADFYYIRGDNMSGPGLTPALSNNLNGHYGPYNLTPYDGVAGGSDFQSISNDTMLRQVMTRTLTDSTTISQFYGPAGDSLSFSYNMSLFTYASFTADNSSTVSTSALVNFRFEYCTCPLSALPVGLKNFTVAKQGSATSGLRWEAEAGSDNYYYEIEVSRDGRRFNKVGSLNKQVTLASPSYLFNHAIKPAEYGRYYYRVKQQWYDGYYRYSDVRSLDYANPLFSTVSIYPNPSSGRAGIKFVSARAGRYTVQITNAAGQVVNNQELQVAETDYKQLAILQKGLYYVKITESATGASGVQQLVVQ